MAREQRRLAAIMAADVAGYSRLMGRNEAATLMALKAHRTELLDPLVAENSGRIVKTTGDGLLLEFASAVDAVRCAVALQEGMQKRNHGIPAEQRIVFRLGLTVGDIVLDGDDIFGDGVNTAARLEQIAEPGGLMMSQAVYDQLQGRLDVACEYVGEQVLKNIARPVRAWALRPARTQSTVGIWSTTATRDDGDSLHGPGTVLNNTHRIDEVIARGGMGDIYRATNLVTGEPCAVKTIRNEHIDDPKFVQLFKREALALRRVSHPAIIRYEGVFNDSTGGLYLAMEYVDGPSLAEALRAGALRPQAVVELRDRLAGALAAAHSQGVVHRDMSTGNVILPNGRLDQAKIIDFGIARHMDPDIGVDAGQQKTLIGTQFAGNLQFVSPEQLVGGPADARSDIYSLGLVLAAAALGHSLDMGTTLAKAIETRRRVPDLTGIPPELRRWLTPMLHPDPARRPASAADLLAVPSSGPRYGRWIAAGLVTASLAAAVAGYRYLPDLFQKPASNDVADWDSVNQRDPAALRRFADRNPSHARASEARALAERLDAALQNASESAAWDSLNRGDAVALRSFLERFPNGGHAAEARRALETLERERQLAAEQQASWDAVAKQDPQALRQFADANRNHPRAEEARRLASEIEVERQRIAERSAWEALDRRDLVALQAFLQRYPNGAHAGEANQAIARIEAERRQSAEQRALWDGVDKQDAAALRRFAERNPSHRNAAEARRLAQQLDDSREQAARSAWEFVNRNDPAALRAFAQRHASSSFAEEAVKLAEGLERDRVRQAEQQAIWDKLDKQDPAALLRFAEANPGHPRTADARKQAEQIALERQRVSERSAWEALDRSNAAAIRAFLARYPDGAYGAQARQLLDKVEADRRQEAAWTELDKQDVAAVRRFIAAFPGHPRLAEARRLLEQLDSQAAWDSINKKDSVALRRFADANPNNPRAAEARRLADQADAERQQQAKQGWDAVNKNDAAALRGYANANPSSPYSAQARQRADRLEQELKDWPALPPNNPLALRQFLLKYPDGRYASDVRQRLAQMEQQEWQALSARGIDEVSLQKFIADYPGGQYVREAQRQLAALRAPDQGKTEPQRPTRPTADPDKAYDPSVNVPQAVVNLGTVPEGAMSRIRGPRPPQNPNVPLFNVQIQQQIRISGGFSEMTVMVVNNHHERILDPVVDCEFLHNGARVAIRRFNPRGVQPGETVTASVVGPPAQVYVTDARCMPIGPFK